MYFIRRMMLVLVGSLLIPFFGLAGEWVEEEAPVETPKAVESTVEQPAPPVEEPAAVEAPVAEESVAAEAPAPPDPVPAEPAPTSAAAPAPAPAASSPEMGYAVQKGDTLWDLAARYYQDPFKWGRIWEANRDAIQNPDRIYPDQKFNIPGLGEAAPSVAETPGPIAATSESSVPVEAQEASTEVAPADTAAVEEAVVPVEAAPVEEAVEAAPAEAEDSAVEVEAPTAVAEVPESAPLAPKKKVQRYVPTDLGGDNLIVDENWEADGYILRDEYSKLMIAQDDVVYLNVGAANGAKPFMRGGIYRRGGKVKDPDTKKRLGYIMRRVGTFQLTENVGDQSATAIVTTSKEPVRIGDIVRLENN